MRPSQTDHPAGGSRIIAIVHRGYSWYLPYVLRQVRAFNPGAEIVLFAERRRLFFRPFCRTALIHEYSGTAHQLEATYENLSPNGRAYELFCLQRWAILLEYARRHSVQELIHLDSDTMVFCDLWNTVDREWADHDLVTTGFQGPQSLFIRNLAALQGFWDSILHAYRCELPTLRREYADWQAQGQWGGISDMHFLHRFVASCGLRVGDNAVPKSDALFDQSINRPDGFRFAAGHKQLEFIHNQPYGHLAADGRRLRFNSLHLQGMTKKWIPSCSTRRSLHLPLFSLVNRARRLVGLPG